MLTETSGFLIFPCGVAGSIAAYSAVERAVNEHLVSFIGKLFPPGHGISASYITFNVFQHHMVCLNISMLVLM